MDGKSVKDALWSDISEELNERNPLIDRARGDGSGIHRVERTAANAAAGRAAAIRRWGIVKTLEKARAHIVYYRLS